MNLTDRQAQMLKAIIEEFTTTANLSAAFTLEKKYNLGVSPATSETKWWPLPKPAFSNSPTLLPAAPPPDGFKILVHELLKEDEMSVAEEVAVKEKVWDNRFEAGKFWKVLPAL